MLILCVFCEIKVEINSVFIQVTFFLESFVEKTIVCPLNYYFDTFVKSPFITCIWVYFWTSFSFIYMSVFVLYGLNYCSFTKVLFRKYTYFCFFKILLAILDAWDLHIKFGISLFSPKNMLEFWFELHLIYAETGKELVLNSIEFSCPLTQFISWNL